MVETRRSSSSSKRQLSSPASSPLPSGKRTPRQELPVDVVGEILLKLPVKQVLRCKLLSKTYCALIRTPNFINRHIRLHRLSALENANIVLAPSDTKYYSTDGGDHKIVSLQPSPSYVYVPRIPQSRTFLYLVGSCNGLLCAVIKDNYNRSNFLLWNPATGEHKILPPPDFKRQHGLLGNTPAYLNKSVHAVGFGYDDRNCDYKLVIIKRGDQSNHLKFWSMKTNSWVKVAIQEELCKGEVTGISVGSRLYWLTSTLREDASFVYVIEWFDMVSGSFCTVTALPDDAIALYEGNYRVVSIIDFMGSLACSVIHRNKFDIWVLDEDCHLWTKRFSIGPFQKQADCTRVNIRGRFLMRVDKKYSLYDHVDDEDEGQKLECEPLISEADTNSYQAWSWIESLASPFHV